MGCWNNTCGLTNLPIIVGEAVYVFPVKEEDLSGYRSHCETGALYKPVLTPFEAVYNDYGAGEDCSGVALDLFVTGLRDRMVEMEVGENEYHDIAVKKEGFDIDTFFEAVHEDRMFVKGWGKKNQPVYFAMVRKDVVDRLWHDWKFDVYVGDGKAADPNDAYERNMTYARIAELIPAYVDHCIEAYNMPPAPRTRPADMSDEAWNVVNSKAYRRLSMQIMPKVEDNLLCRYLRTLEFHNHWDAFDFKHALECAADVDDRAKMVELLRLALLGCMVDDMMGSTRKIWLPAMHMGSQSEDYDAYRILNTVVTDVINARESYFNEEYEDDE
jgi:hypothetical protein